ncbi:hypothetical protein LPTSP3_g02340 [Leptospira kobayashii]|uniref:Uncharacterized protein n=1 Tax=Leptospira kobayashii TaxID=1917830 RepID=A0ABN6KAP7_9LEPT|nr:hypothetical protein [Leptospira kobayashii]BDA77304.1 hypothetical protein LPTSP3_g02340 [Leptospira kobayashii]
MKLTIKFISISILCILSIPVHSQSKSKQSLLKEERPSSDSFTPAKEEENTSETKKEHSEGGEHNDHPVEVKLEFATDYIRRGWALGTEDVSRMNNTPYKSFQPVWAFQPTIEFPTPIKHLYGEVFLNLWMSNRGDKDNEQRILQSQSGGPELFPRYQHDLQTGNFCPSPSSCYNPLTVEKYVNQNGMARNSAGEFTLFYDFEKSKYGRFKVGAFRYAIFPTSGSGGLAKTQTFVSWEIPFLTFLNPKLSVYKTVNFQNQGTPATGLNRSNLYIPLELSHVFREGEFFKVTLGTNIGYMYQANPKNKTSGFSDISSFVKLHFGDFFVTGNHVNRPDVHLYDNNNYFDGATRLTYDGHVQDPSKLYGYDNTFIYDRINSFTSDTLLRQYLKETYNQQRIVTNFFYFSLGYSRHF